MPAGDPMAESMVPPDDVLDTSFSGTRRFGATFSTKELERRGLDWRPAFDQYCTLGFNAVRVGCYWSDCEPEQGRFDWSLIDELLERCQVSNLQVVLTVGMKGPRWPEFHIPVWAGADVEDSDVTHDRELCLKCLDYVEALILHVQSYKCIIAFQIENEPLDKAGARRQVVGIDFVAEEANLVRKLDRQLRPIVITAWCWSFKHDNDVKDAIRYANIVGLDVYSKVRGDDTSGEKRSAVLPKHYRELALSKGREAWITELQAEPWNPSHFEVEDLDSLLSKVNKAEFTTIFLWGFEKWLDLKRNKDDPSMWNAAKVAAHAHLGTRR